MSIRSILDGNLEERGQGRTHVIYLAHNFHWKFLETVTSDNIVLTSDIVQLDLLNFSLESLNLTLESLSLTLESLNLTLESLLVPYNFIEDVETIPSPEENSYMLSSPPPPHYFCRRGPHN